MESELIRAIKSELGITHNGVDEDIKLYINDGKKQISYYLGTEKLTSTLILVIKGYVGARMVENDYKYVEDLKRPRGLEISLEKYIEILNQYKRMDERREKKRNSNSVVCKQKERRKES